MEYSGVQYNRCDDESEKKFYSAVNNFIEFCFFGNHVSVLISLSSSSPSSSSGTVTEAFGHSSVTEAWHLLWTTEPQSRQT